MSAANSPVGVPDPAEVETLAERDARLNAWLEGVRPGDIVTVRLNSTDTLTGKVYYVDPATNDGNEFAGSLCVNTVILRFGNGYPGPSYEPVANHDRELGERIAAAIEARQITCYSDELGNSARNALSIAAAIARAESERARQHTRPYCLRCEVPIYRDDEGVWRREATGSQVCPRNPAVDGHEPLQHTGTGRE